MFSSIRKTLVLSLAATLSLGLAVSCGKKKADDGAKADGKADDKTAKAGGSPCTEKNQLEFTPAEGDGLKLETPFSTKMGTGYISGMRYNNKALAKLGYVAIGNYDVALGPYGIDMPKDPKEIAVLISFKTKSEDVEFEKQEALYKTLKVPTGEYAKPGWMDPEQIFQVNYFVGGKNGGPALTGTNAKGKATLTVATPEWICGSIDLTSEKGSTVKGTFAVKVAKDFWAK
ncbi:hypothetical protein KKD52_06035 [Myxococcota bacterium]|nr:hypothetical protein [Myxococcota bacterium]MBU1410079.1 hypothetical protein [Myxococcota bacterium]MBU1509902.1 hypothetical protein [Myxococcota bacterium]